MLNYIKEKIKRHRLKRTFAEYSHKVVKFNLEQSGEVEYAQWQHPFDEPKTITQSNVNFYKVFVKEGDFLIDRGSHSGDTTVPMALAAGKSGMVLALEPNPYVYKILQANANLNKTKTNIIPICFAATETDGEFEFNYSDASFCNGGFLSKISYKHHKHSYVLKVKGINLQNYLLGNYKDHLNKLTLIKMDAEGYDKEIIKSLTKIIKEFRPVLLAECYRKLSFPERTDLYNTISSLDYQLYNFNDFEKSSLTKIRLENMNNSKHMEIAAIPNEKTEIINLLEHKL